MPSTCDYCHGALEPTARRCPVCNSAVSGAPVEGEALPPYPPLAPGTIVDQKYAILESLGVGGFGSVFRVLHTMLQREFALKTLHPGVAADRGLRERFTREARVLLDLTHPNIVTLRDVGQHQGMPYMVMDLVPGETLEALLKREGRLPGVEVVRLALPLLDALDAAHRKGVIHRDLKPANVMVSHLEKGQRAVHILDFGIAKMLEPVAGDDPGTLTGGVLIGTPHYMSPEQAQGEPLDGRSDLFSLGAVLYQAATGKRPFHGARGVEVLRRLLHDAVPPFTDWGVADDPRGLEAALRQALAKDPDDRPACAREMRQALEALGRGDGLAKARTERRSKPRPASGAQTAASPAGGEAARGAIGRAGEPPVPPPREPAPEVASVPVPPPPVWTLPSPDDGHIVFACVCGTRITVRDIHAGRPGMCPHCWHAVRVPVPSVREPRRTTEFVRCRSCAEPIELAGAGGRGEAFCTGCGMAHRASA